MFFFWVGFFSLLGSWWLLRFPVWLLASVAPSAPVSLASVAPVSCSRKAKAVASPTILPQIIPAIHNPARASVEPETTSSAASMSPEHLELRSLLRSTSLGHLYQPMCDQGVSIPDLQRFQIRMSIGESHTLMQALEHRAAAGASSSSLAACIFLHLLIPFPCLIMFLLRVPSLCTMLLCLRCCLGLQRV